MIMKQDQLGDMLRRMTPPVEEAGVWSSIERRTKPKRRKQISLLEGSNRRRLVRLFVFGATAVVLAIALGFGVNALVERMGQNGSVVMITDAAMSPGGTNRDASVGGDASSGGNDAQQRSYGQAAVVDGLRIVVTGPPTLAPITDSDPLGILMFHGEGLIWTRFRSHYTVTNESGKPRTFSVDSLVLLDQDGHRYNPMGKILELKPGATTTGRLDWYVDQDAEAQAVIYSDHSGENVPVDRAVWRPTH
jgi:hypothetical protein